MLSTTKEVGRQPADRCAWLEFETEALAVFYPGSFLPFPAVLAPD
jgi:hypothetical protein